MRLAHLSDTHLGFSEFEIEHGGFNARELDAYRAFEEACAKIREARPDVLIHTGDLFDRPRPPMRALAVALRGFASLTAAGIPVVVIAGNHDLPSGRGTASPLEVLEAVPDVHAVPAAPSTVRVRGLTIHAIPHGREDAMRRAVDGAPGADILAIHAGLRDSGEREWSEARVPREAVAAQAQRHAYVALGHYHRPMRICPNAWYAGSTERFHPEETGYEKGFLLFHSGEVRHVAVSTRPVVELDPLDCRGLTAAQIALRVRERLGGVPPEAVVRVTLERLTAEQERSLVIRGGVFRLEVRKKRRPGRTAALEWTGDPLEVLPERFLEERSPELVPLLRHYLVAK